MDPDPDPDSIAILVRHMPWPRYALYQCLDSYAVVNGSWSSTSLFSTNMPISETSPSALSLRLKSLGQEVMKCVSAVFRLGCFQQRGHVCLASVILPQLAITSQMSIWTLESRPFVRRCTSTRCRTALRAHAVVRRSLDDIPPVEKLN